MRGRKGDNEPRTNIDQAEPLGAFVGDEAEVPRAGVPPRWSKGKTRVSSGGFMAEGESQATSVKAARVPTHWRRGGFVRQATGGPVPGDLKTKPPSDVDFDEEKPTNYKSGGKLSMAQRKALPSTSFALPGKGKGPSGKGSGSYPIPDASHARNALARASGKPVEAAVRAKVHAKFPGIGKK